MVYEEAQGTIVYTGDVEIRQGDILTLSPEAVVTLTRDGGAVERLVAGTPVEVRQGNRRATGERGTYTPADERLVLVGEKVVLQDADRRLEGRVLTFEVGSDRIRVDGRDEVRTEAVFKRKEPPSP
jgi:lipopolysaccharide transport protein LptA